MGKRFVSVALMAATCAVAAPRLQAEPEFNVSVGAEYTTGDYGTGSDTRIWYFPATFQYATERHALGLTVPFLIVDGTGAVVPGVRGAMRSGRAVGARRTESGLGDLELRASTLLMAESAERPRLDLTGKIKFGTADEGDNLGTGEDDYALQLDVERNYGRNSLFGSAGYKILGDPPGVNFKNVLYGSIGGAHDFDAVNRAGLLLDAQQAVLGGTPSALELNAFFSRRIAPDARLTVYLLKGLKDGSPDWGAGVTLKLSLQ